ncbi:MAG: putative zinc-binding protein [Planctomycetota bacterium]|jgi:uncharacterized metal-binding protein
MQIGCDDRSVLDWKVERKRKEEEMKGENRDIELKIASTTRHCPIGETIGKRSMEQSKIPVLSCEGPCIRGEIARQAANIVAKEAPYGRGCHGELMTVPDSSIARWFKTADKVVLIDGCFLRCHGRILQGMLGGDKLIQFDALAVHRKYSDIFDVDDVPEAERMATARQVADYVLACLDREEAPYPNAPSQQGGCGN